MGISFVSAIAGASVAYVSDDPKTKLIGMGITAAAAAPFSIASYRSDHHNFNKRIKRHRTAAYRAKYKKLNA